MIENTNIQNERKSNWKDIKKHILVGWGSPGLLIGAAILLDYFGDIPNRFKPQYNQHVCWIQPRGLEHVIFYVPLLILVGINITFFLLIALYLRRAFSNRNQLITEQRNNFRTYIKLFLMMGVNYTLLFFAPFTDHMAFWLTLILINVSHGLYVSVPPVFRRDVFVTIFKSHSYSTRREKLENVQRKLAEGHKPAKADLK